MLSNGDEKVGVMVKHFRPDEPFLYRQTKRIDLEESNPEARARPAIFPVVMRGLAVYSTLYGSALKPDDNIGMMLFPVVIRGLTVQPCL